MVLRSALRRGSLQSWGEPYSRRLFSSNASFPTARPPRQDATSSLTGRVQRDLEEGSRQLKEPPPRRDERTMNLVNNYANKHIDRAKTSGDLTKLGDASEARLRADGMKKLQTRDWQPGDVYAPHDLTPPEMKKWRNLKSPTKDVFDMLNINPLDEWKNPAVLAEFMTSMGRIKHPSETGLRPVNQRKIAKAIRRAIGMGFHPSVHVHPELLRRGKSEYFFR